MGYEPHLITPFVNSGLSQYFKPFNVGETQFPDIEDAYPWRGVVKKREGTKKFSSIPTTPVQGLKTFINPSTLVPNSIAFSLTKSYGFLSGSYTDITQLADGNTTFSFGTGQFNYYWTSNFAGSMWTTNGLPYINASGSIPTTNVNGIFFLTANATNSWNILNPQVSGGVSSIYLLGGLIIIPYKRRLVILNTIEGDNNGGSRQSFPNRARWCQIGNPYPTKYNIGGGASDNTSPPVPFAPGDTNAWRSDIPGRGGVADAETSERIVSAAVINDVLIVTFQRSTWRLNYTGNEVLPFLWQKIDGTYGAESTFSAIPFGDTCLFFSRYGFTSTTTNKVERIDENIPDVSFAFETGDSNFDNLATVQGIRDFYRQMAYWTYTSIEGTADNQIYAYNYLDKSWAVFNPTVPINCFGEYYNVTDQTWASFNQPDDIWANFNGAEDTWKNLGSSQNLGFPTILGGDANGNIYTMFQFDAPPTTDNGTAFNFFIQTKRFNPYFQKGSRCRIGYVDLYVSNATYGEITFQHFVDDKSYPILQKNVSLYPRGVMQVVTLTQGATTTIVTQSAHNLINNQTVVFGNFYGTIAQNINNQTANVTVVDALTFTVPIDTIGKTVTSLGYVWLPPFNDGDARYVRIYLGATGYHHQFVLTLSDQQLTDPIKASTQFEMQGMVIWSRSTGGKIKG